VNRSRRTVQRAWPARAPARSVRASRDWLRRNPTMAAGGAIVLAMVAVAALAP
jgi:hypothetical protein